METNKTTGIVSGGKRPPCCSPRGRCYVGEDILAKAKEAIAAGTVYEVRISTLQFLRFEDDKLTLYWADSVHIWKKKQIQDWQNMDEGRINSSLRNAAWEVWM